MSRRILVDLSPAQGTTAGVKQDARTMFRTLSGIPGTKACGLLFPMRATYASRPPFPRGADSGADLKSVCEYLAILCDGASSPKSLLERAGFLARRIRRRLGLTNREFGLFTLSNDLHFDLVWRTYLSGSLAQDDYAFCRDSEFAISDISIEDILTGGYRPRLMARLDTSGFQYCILQEPRSVRLHPGTRRLIRYHDTIPITEIDLLPDSLVFVRMHFATLAGCLDDSVFVCGSDPTRESLLRLMPQLEGRVHLVPYALPSQYIPNRDPALLAEAILSSLSPISYPDREAAAVVQNLLGSCRPEEFRFVLGVSTLEPRKNFVSLVRAWQRARQQAGDIKLVVVGTPGWKYEPILREMKPHVQRGDLIHLENVGPSELACLYSWAECLVYASFNEGFGLPPMEAMQCGCPTIVSDIPIFHWTTQGSSLYVDPHSIDDIAAKISLLTASGQRVQLRGELANKGLANVQRFQYKAVGEAWEKLFEDLERNGPKVSARSG
jgi:hypothetical protein